MVIRAIELKQSMWKAANAPGEARMKYRCVEYSVVRIEGGVWKWSASVDGVSIMGLATSDSEAVAGAENAVDQALALKKLRNVPPRQPD
jgi:hypothetical protein